MSAPHRQAVTQVDARQLGRRAAPGSPRPGWRWERALWRDGFPRVAGVDEVGRGPIAGPVVAGAVVFRRYSRAGWVGELRDSKLLSAPARERLAVQVRRHCDWGVGVVSTQVIDQIGIAPASRLAMMRALGALGARAPRPDGLIVDGRERLDWPAPAHPARQIAVIGGDGHCVSIAAASIVAKVARDAMLVELDRRFPDYGLARHKGYATAEHLAALRRHGGSTVHRYSFAPVRETLAAAATP